MSSRVAAAFVVVLVDFNAAGKAQRLVVNHRPRSSVLVLSRVMLERFAGTPLAKHWEGTPSAAAHDLRRKDRPQ